MPKLATIKMKSEDVAEVLLYDQIGFDPWFGEGIAAKDFREQLKTIKAKTINLRINSPGGSVTEGAAILAALDDHKATIEVDIDGLAASAASVVAMAGSRIRMASNALMMIHDPYAGVLGTSADMRHTADLLDKVKGQIIDSYKRHSNLSDAELSKAMAEETWYTGKEAVDAGLAHEVTEAMSIAACADLSKFKYRHAPKIENKAAAILAEYRKRLTGLAKAI